MPLPGSVGIASGSARLKVVALPATGICPAGPVPAPADVQVEAVSGPVTNWQPAAGSPMTARRPGAAAQRLIDRLATIAMALLLLPMLAAVTVWLFVGFLLRWLRPRRTRRPSRSPS